MCFCTMHAIIKVLRSWLDLLNHLPVAYATQETDKNIVICITLFVNLFKRETSHGT